MTSADSIYGLLLIGGQSKRMGEDKSELKYHDQKQRDHLFDLLDAVCDMTFVSCRKDQITDLKPDQHPLPDTLQFRSPLNGILSAHIAHPRAAWLVLAVDLPHITRDSLEKLLAGREPGRLATAYATRESGKPEPLVAIWEPAGLRKAMRYAKEGGRCPRKFLMQNDVDLLHPEDDLELFNANYPHDFMEAKKRIVHS